MMSRKPSSQTKQRRLPTLSDVASEAGVSRSAVARVLLGTGGEHVRVGEDAQMRIHEAARQIGYTPNRNAQQLRGLSSRTIGVIVDSVNTRAMAERIFAIEEAAACLDYRILVGRVHGGVEQLDGYVADFMGRGVDAILCLFDLAPGRDARVKSIFKKRFPKVIFHGRAAWRGGFAVQIDIASAIRAAVGHLAERGKRRLGLALWNLKGDELMEIRRSAFVDALKIHGLPMDEGLIWDAASESATPDVATMDRGVESLVIEHQVDAILASNDIWAVRFIQTLKVRGFRVPQDIAVIGYDDLDIGRVVEPALTSVNPNHEAYANACLKLLMQVVGDGLGSASERTLKIQPLLVVRESS